MIFLSIDLQGFIIQNGLFNFSYFIKYKDKRCLDLRYLKKIVFLNLFYLQFVTFTQLIHSPIN